MQTVSRLKQLIGALGISAVFITQAHAEVAADSNQLLQTIANNTYNTFQAINNLPGYFSSLGDLTMSWLADDSSNNSFTTKNQGEFASLGYWYKENEKAAMEQQSQVLATLLNKPITDIKGMGGFIPMPATITQLLPNVNDLSYASLLGKPPVDRAPTDTYNYISYAAGLNNHHEIPKDSWDGKDKDKKRYEQFFNTMVSIQSFNGYILSNLYVENQNGNNLTGLQQDLTTSASSSSWFLKVSTEELGKVIRHILLFESQNYVLMTQLVKLQRELLTAQVMTNTLLMGVSPSEQMLLAAAKGKPLGT